MPKAENGSAFGARIRERRMALGLSLRDLARQVNLSSSFIAQAERGEASPSIASLHQIAAALQVPILYFFTDERPQERVIREGRRKKIHFPDCNITYEFLVPSLNRKSMGLVVRLGPGDHISPLKLSEPTEEWMLVLEGAIAIDVAGQKYELTKGDSISYEGWELQGVTSMSQVESILVVGMTPPAF